MTYYNELLARWQGKKCVCGSDKYHDDYCYFYACADYPNDEAACGSLLDTLVEKDYDYAVFGNSKKTDVRIYDSDGIGICMSIKPTRREAIVAACLEVARKELSNG